MSCCIRLFPRTRAAPSDGGTHELQARPATPRPAATTATTAATTGPARRTSTQAGARPPRARLEDLPTELLQQIPVDPRALQVNRRLAVVFHDAAVSRGFTERPFPVHALADVDLALVRLQTRLRDSPALRDAPLAELAKQLHQVPTGERAAAHARIADAAAGIHRPLEALAELLVQAPYLPTAADQAAGLERVMAHRAGPLAQMMVRADRMLDPSDDMPALHLALRAFPEADQTLVLGRLAKQLLTLPHLGSHDFAFLAMAHHDLPWPAAAVEGMLGRIGWIPDDVMASLRRRLPAG